MRKDEPKGLNTMTFEEGDDMPMPHTDQPEISQPVGSEIMALIQDRVKMYGDSMSDHAMSVVECWIEDRGFNMEDIQFCTKRYREGHRIFTPRIKEA